MPSASIGDRPHRFRRELVGGEQRRARGAGSIGALLGYSGVVLLLRRRGLAIDEKEIPSDQEHQHEQKNCCLEVHVSLEEV